MECAIPQISLVLGGKTFEVCHSHVYFVQSLVPISIQTVDNQLRLPRRVAICGDVLCDMDFHHKELD